MGRRRISVTIVHPNVLSRFQFLVYSPVPTTENNTNVVVSLQGLRVLGHGWKKKMDVLHHN